MIRPSCLVRMPFGRGPSAGHGLIDFDAVCRDRIHPADQLAGLEPLRTLPYSRGPGGTPAAAGTDLAALVVPHRAGPSPAP